MARAKTTRLRFVTGKKPEDIQMFCDMLGRRIQIYGCPQVTKDGKFILWFVPGDDSPDIKSIHIK